MSDTPQFLALSVGEPSPFPGPGRGEGAVTVTLSHEAPLMLVHLPDVTQDDITAIKGYPVGIALRQSTALPTGALLLVLKQGDDKAWPIAAPVLDEEPVLRAWAEIPEANNTMLVVLIDSVTNIVRAQRTIGAPHRLLELVRSGIRRAQKIQPLQGVAEFNRWEPHSIWEHGTRWNLDDNEEFQMTREQTAPRG